MERKGFIIIGVIVMGIVGSLENEVKFVLQQLQQFYSYKMLCKRKLLVVIPEAVGFIAKILLQKECSLIIE